MIWAIAGALAQGIPVFDVDAEGYRPSTDATRTLAVDDTQLPERWMVSATLHYQRNPFVFVDGYTEERTRIVKDALGVQIAGASRIGQLRIGATAPAYVWVTSDVADSRSVLGDPSIDLKYAVLEGKDEPVGFAVLGAIDVPLGAAERHLGSSGFAGRLGVAAEVSRAQFYAVLNGAIQLEGAQEVFNTRMGSHLSMKAALGWQAADQVAVQLEVLTRIGVLQDARQDDPMEVLLAAHRTRTGGPAPFLAAGTGLNPGIGAPALRVLLGVRYRQ